MMPSHSASDYGNDAKLEMLWAKRAHEHAEIFINLLNSVDTTVLKLSKIDDEIYTHFREEFPDMKIDKIDENDLKSQGNKTKWREFCNLYKDRVDDFNYGTLLRVDCTQDYSETNSIFALRSQFLAIEIARNREGYNKPLRSNKKKET